jgi:hypothetical protein
MVWSHNPSTTVGIELAVVVVVVSSKTREPQLNMKKATTPTTAMPLEGQTIQVDDKVYSAKGLADNHPGLLQSLDPVLIPDLLGGELFVKAFAGRDATEAFLSYHRKKFPHEKVSSYLVGKAIAAKASPDADKDYLELCGIIEQVLPRSLHNHLLSRPHHALPPLETKHLLLPLISSKHSLF